AAFLGCGGGEGTGAPQGSTSASSVSSSSGAGGAGGDPASTGTGGAGTGGGGGAGGGSGSSTSTGSSGPQGVDPSNGMGGDIPPGQTGKSPLGAVIRIPTSYDPANFASPVIWLFNEKIESWS